MKTKLDLKINADYTHLIIREQDFKVKFGVEFYGPGLYTTDNVTIIVVPILKNGFTGNMSSVKQPYGTIYRCYVYNTNFCNTVFGLPNGLRNAFDSRS